MRLRGPWRVAIAGGGLAVIIAVAALWKVDCNSMPHEESPVLLTGDWGRPDHGLRCRLHLVEGPDVAGHKRPALRVRMEFQNVSDRRVRIMLTPRRCKCPPMFDFLVEQDGATVKERAGMGGVAFGRAWRDEGGISPGGFASATVILLGFSAPDIERWHRTGALLKLRLRAYHDESYWQGQAISGGIPFPATEGGPAE